MVGRLTLDQEVGVRVPAPQPSIQAESGPVTGLSVRRLQTRTVVGHAAVFKTWIEVRSAAEGHFLERVAPGAFTRMIAEDRSRMRVLFQHGRGVLVSY
jgi:phage head maturation protease